MMRGPSESHYGGHGHREGQRIIATLTICHRLFFRSILVLCVPLGGRKQGQESIDEARSSVSPRVPHSPAPVLWEGTFRLLVATLQEPTASSSRRPHPADSHVLDARVHPAGGPGDAALLLWDPDRRLALSGLR